MHNVKQLLFCWTPEHIIFLYCSCSTKGYHPKKSPFLPELQVVIVTIACGCVGFITKQIQYCFNPSLPALTQGCVWTPSTANHNEIVIYRNSSLRPKKSFETAFKSFLRMKFFIELHTIATRRQYCSYVSSRLEDESEKLSILRLIYLVIFDFFL